MGWWPSADGSGIIGDAPADVMGDLLDDAIGQEFDTDLFAGFLVAIGGALKRNARRLIADPDVLEGSAICAWLGDEPPLVVPLGSSQQETSLDEHVDDALESIAFRYRTTDFERPPRLAEVLETVAFAARGRIVSAEDGRPLALRGIEALPWRDIEATAAPLPGSILWRGLRQVLAAGSTAVAESRLLVTAGLVDADWRARMTALLAVGRLRLAELAEVAAAVEVPDTDVGLEDDERRARLALRDIAPQLAVGRPADSGRPVHPDSEIAGKRAEFVAKVTATIDGTGWPPPSHPAYVLRALVEPEAVRASAPPQWRRWLTPE
jgi:hypothetical protein